MEVEAVVAKQAGRQRLETKVAGYLPGNRSVVYIGIQLSDLKTTGRLLLILIGNREYRLAELCQLLWHTRRLGQVEGKFKITLYRVEQIATSLIRGEYLFDCAGQIMLGVTQLYIELRITASFHIY